jgi:diguanylate cyclase (GGDEF)-like protein/PAS domain S-box-containing protein
MVDGADVARRTVVALVVVRDGAVEWCNPAAEALVAPHGGSWSEGPPAPLAAVRPGTVGAPVRWPAPAGGTRWWAVTCSTLGDGALLYEITDETAVRSADGRELGPQTAQWRLARLEAMARTGSWVWHVDDGRVEWSDALLTLFGFEPATELDFATYRARLHPDDVEMIESTLAEALRTLEPFTYTHRMFLGDGGERVFECYGEVFTDAAGRPDRVLGTARDITEQHRAQRELAFLAEHDPLTGVANRRRITGWLVDLAIAGSGALLLVDIDDFKDVNDLHGHAAGDRVIRAVARALAARLGPEARLGRLGGDEFAVVVPDADVSAGLALAEQLCDAVAAAGVDGGGSGAPGVTISVGVAAVEPGQEVETVLAHADLALYGAKAAGRNRARGFAPDQYHQAAHRVSLLRRVAAALEEGTMGLDAQPIVDLATGRATRHELLVRLRDGHTPPLSPAEFLPAVERTDLVHQLDRDVVSRAVSALARPAARTAGLRLEVNLSARSLEDPELGTWILHRLKEADVEPQRLGLEITETAAITSLPAARVLADRLTGAGCGFALDDFGAGFGSFAHLKHLPFTSVKIAGEFVRQLDSEAVDRAMVTGVVGVARQLEVRTVAEHVDRPVLVERLRELGVDDGQGFHLGRPRPLIGPGAAEVP